MKKLVLLLVIFIWTQSAAQTEADIRKYYISVNQQITESITQGYEGPLYNNQWITNKNNRSWPAVGRYSETTDLWYNDPPEHLPATERNPRNVLLKVNLNRISSHLQANEEFLFKDGKLLFYYSKQAEEGAIIETRLYFNTKGIMFKSSVKVNELELTAKDFLDPDQKDLKPNPVRIKAEAVKYQDLFIRTM
jgi:hypothetical protein